MGVGSKQTNALEKMAKTTTENVKQGEKHFQLNKEIQTWVVLTTAVFAIISGLSSAVFGKLIDLYPYVVWAGLVAIVVLLVVLRNNLRKLNINKSTFIGGEEGNTKRE